jgi:hypothetical protein
MGSSEHRSWSYKDFARLLPTGLEYLDRDRKWLVVVSGAYPEPGWGCVVDCQELVAIKRREQLTAGSLGERLIRMMRQVLREFPEPLSAIEAAHNVPFVPEEDRDRIKDMAKALFAACDSAAAEDFSTCASHLEAAATHTEQPSVREDLLAWSVRASIVADQTKSPKPADLRRLTKAEGRYWKNNPSGFADNFRRDLQTDRTRLWRRRADGYRRGCCTPPSEARHLWNAAFHQVHNHAAPVLLAVEEHLRAKPVVWEGARMVAHRLQHSTPRPALLQHTTLWQTAVDAAGDHPDPVLKQARLSDKSNAPPDHPVSADAFADVAYWLALHAFEDSISTLGERAHRSVAKLLAYDTETLRAQTDVPMFTSLGGREKIAKEVLERWGWAWPSRKMPIMVCTILERMEAAQCPHDELTEQFAVGLRTSLENLCKQVRRVQDAGPGPNAYNKQELGTFLHWLYKGEDVPDADIGGLKRTLADLNEAIKEFVHDKTDEQHPKPPPSIQDTIKFTNTVLAGCRQLCGGALPWLFTPEQSWGEEPKVILGHAERHDLARPRPLHVLCWGGNDLPMDRPSVIHDETGQNPVVTRWRHLGSRR